MQRTEYPRSFLASNKARYSGVNWAGPREPVADTSNATGYAASMMVPILYSFRRCPYAMRARLAVLASGVVVELREVVLRDKPASMIAVSPKATVPVLVLPDGAVIDESLDIMRWAFATGERAGWLDGFDEGLITANDGPFKHHLDRYKYANRYDVDPVEHRAHATAYLGLLEDRLKGRLHLGGAGPNLSDSAILPFVRQFAETDRRYFDALPLVSVQDWLARFVASPMFAQVMVRFPGWRPGDQQTLFPHEATPVL